MTAPFPDTQALRSFNTTVFGLEGEGRDGDGNATGAVMHWGGRTT